MDNKDISFSASAAMIKRLGDELIKDFHTAFFELIKNCYDADATQVEVKFRNIKKDNGVIIIQDNGAGMSLDDLKQKWARVAGENKVRAPYTEKYNRRRLGAKGIGRFSAAKLGNKIKITTKRECAREQLVFKIDFRDFTDEKNLDEIKIHCKSGKTRQGFSVGTIIEISDLKQQWRKPDIRKVRNQLCNLIDPDEEDKNFSIDFKIREYPDLSGRLDNPISAKHTHLLKFSIDSEGNYKIELSREHEEEEEEEEAKIALTKKEQRKPPSFGPVKGIIRYFKEGLKSSERKLGENESHMGVKIYRDGCRVRPYGEERDDWLEIKARRARGGGKYYLLPNAIAGSVQISSSRNERLTDSTDRESGITASEEFSAFRTFVMEQIGELNKQIEQETRSEAKKSKRVTVRKILDTVTRSLNEQSSEVYKGYLDKIDRGKRGDIAQSYSKKVAVISDVKKPNKVEWHCNDCDEKWRVLKKNKPGCCMEYAVTRDGEPRDVEGCGSTNIERAKRETRDENESLSSIVSGDYALVSGKKVEIRVEYEDMHAQDDEYKVDEREIVINGNHPAYSVAESLDNMSGKKYEIGDNVFVPALTIHIAKCSCLAWGELHFRETKSWDEFKERYDHLLESISKSVKEEMAK